MIMNEEDLTQLITNMMREERVFEPFLARRIAKAIDKKQTKQEKKPTHCPECGEEFYVYQNCARCNPAF